MAQYRISGVDRESGLDTQFTVDAASTENARTKGELRGTAVTGVEEYRGGLYCPAWPPPPARAAAPQPLPAEPQSPVLVRRQSIASSVVMLFGGLVMLAGLPLLLNPPVGAGVIFAGLLIAVVARIVG